MGVCVSKTFEMQLARLITGFLHPFESNKHQHFCFQLNHLDFSLTPENISFLFYLLFFRFRVKKSFFHNYVNIDQARPKNSYLNGSS